MDRTISDIVLDPCAECGSVKSAFVLALSVSNVMLLETLGVDETRARMVVSFAADNRLLMTMRRRCLVEWL